MRRLLLAPLLALMLVLGVVAGAAADVSDGLDVSGTMADRQSWYSEAVTEDGVSTDVAMATYKGKLTIGDQTETASFDVVMVRTYPATFFDDGMGEVSLTGITTWDLRKFGHGTCTGTGSATMTTGEYWQFPMDGQASAKCETGAILTAEMLGAYPFNHPMTKVDYSHYVHHVTGNLD